MSEQLRSRLPAFRLNRVGRYLHAGVAAALVLAACAQPGPAPKVEPVTVKRGQGLQLGTFYCQVDTVLYSPIVGAASVHTFSRGTFWLIKLTTSNTGKDPALFNVSYFRLVVDTTKIAPDFSAARYMGDESFHERIPLAPNQVRAGYLLFDVPDTVRTASLMFMNIRFVLPEKRH